MFTVYARLRKFFSARGSEAVPAWMLEIGTQLQLRYDMARDPMPEPMEDALSRIGEKKPDAGEAHGETANHDRAA